MIKVYFFVQNLRKVLDVDQMERYEYLENLKNRTKKLCFCFY